LKAWDLYNNSSTAFLSFVVESSSRLVVKDLINIPNPVTDATDFVFRHNQAGKPLTVTIDIFRLDGRKVKTIHTQFVPSGFSSGRIHWNCTNDFGVKISRGIYVYQVQITDETGETRFLRNKLVFLR
jgi:hypothetical protein